MHALLRLTIAASAIGCLSITPTAAQKGYHVSRTPDELFAAFVRERQALDDKTNASVDLTHVLIYHDKYPSQTVEYLLRELEQFALTGTPQWLRSEVVFILGSAGGRRAPQPMVDAYDRLDRIYQRSNDPVVKRAVVDAMATLEDCQKACAFLERVATKESADFPGAQGLAVSSLVMQGEQGIAVLKRLDKVKAIRDPTARQRLAILASRDYRLPEPKK